MKKFVFDDEFLPYSEEIDKQGYFYRVCVTWKNDILEILIGSNGVVLDYFENNSFVHTNIIPERMFGHQKSLSHEQLRKIISIIKATDGEGKVFDRRCLFSKK